MELDLYYEKSTKNCYVFMDSDEIIGRVYIKKSALKEIGWQYGDDITITVDVD